MELPLPVFVCFRGVEHRTSIILLYISKFWNKMLYLCKIRRAFGKKKKKKSERFVNIQFAIYIIRIRTCTNLQTPIHLRSLTTTAKITMCQFWKLILSLTKNVVWKKTVFRQLLLNIHDQNISRNENDYIISFISFFVLSVNLVLSRYSLHFIPRFIYSLTRCV